MKRMNRWMGLLLLAAMMLGIMMPAGLGLAEEALPEVGDSLHGFTVQEVREERLVNAPALTLTHDKTGATVLYIATDDVDCSFDISFRTPNLTNKGIPHVFEHITISGSEKYPAQNLFFPMVTQTYNTYINALTYDRFTTYPLASMSEDQLMLLADYYLNGVFHPMIYQDERFYQREAWRYELADKDAPLTLTGTVYNEMRGALTLLTMANVNLLRTIFPGSILGNVNGGDPDFIPDMTWQELLDFHDAYYHPSNSLTVLYGALDLDRFLTMLDGYFSEYDRKTFDIDDGSVPLTGEFVESVYAFPVEMGSPTEQSSFVFYAFAEEDMDLDTSLGMSVLTSLLSHESSPLTQAIHEALPNAQFGAAIDMLMPSPLTYFYLYGINEEDAETFREIVDRELTKLAQDGFNPDLIDAMIAAEEFSYLLIPEMSTLGVTLSQAFANYWAAKDELDIFNKMLSATEALKEKAHTDYFKTLLSEKILENPNTALVTTVPKPGLAEEKAAALAEKLAEVKAGMTDEEIDALVASGKALEAWSQEDAPAELLKSLQAVTADTLPEEYKTYEITEKEVDGLQTMTAVASVGDIGSTSLLLDTSGIPQDLLHYYNLYVSLLGMVDTKSYDSAELQTMITRYLNGVGAKASALWYADKSWRPALTFQWMSLMEDYDTALDIAREVLFDSRVDDLAMIQTVVGQSLLGMRNQLNTATYNLQGSRAVATAFEDAAYTNYLGGLDYYQFLTNCEKLLIEDPDALVASLEAARECVRNSENALVMFAGNEDAIETFYASIGGLVEGIDAQPIEKAALDLPVPAAREGIIVDSAVQYNLLYAPLETLGVEYSEKYVPINLLIYDAFLTPQIRHGIGAYDNIPNVSERGFSYTSYRDPSITQTYAVYEGLASFAEEAPITQEMLDGYIVSSYSGYAMPQGELTGAITAMNNRLLGWPDDIKLTRMREIKSVTVDDLRALSPVFQKLFEEGIRSTGGGAAMIEANEDLFDVIIRLEDLSE